MFISLSSDSKKFLDHGKEKYPYPCINLLTCEVEVYHFFKKKK